MRILLVTPYYIPAWGFGGPVKVVSDMARAFVQRGHHVTVASTDVLDDTHRIQKTEDMIDGVHIRYFPVLNTRAAFRWNVYVAPKFRPWLQAHIHEFDVIHGHDFYTGLHVAVHAVAKPAGVPYFIQPHGALIPIRMRARFSSLKKIWLQVFRSVVHDASGVIASTQTEQAELTRSLNLPIAKVPVVPNGLDQSSIRPRHPNPATRAEYQIAPDHFVGLFFGRIQFIKGIDIAIRGFAQLGTSNWKFMVVGRDDGEQPKLEALVQALGVQARVRFVGPTFGPALAKLMDMSDVFVFPSRSESFPIAVLDACAAGLPVILSPECRIPEVETMGAGIVLKENTPAAVTQALQALMHNSARLLQMSQSGQALIRETFSLDRVIDMYLDHYQRAINLMASSVKK